VLNNDMTLTIKDLDEIEKIVDERIEKQVSNLPTKDEFFGKMDELMGELRDMREEHSMLSERVYNNIEPRVTKIEKNLHIQPTN